MKLRTDDKCNKILAYLKQHLKSINNDINKLVNVYEVK